MVDELKDMSRAVFAQHTVSRLKIFTRFLAHACDCLLGAAEAGHVFTMTDGPLPGSWVEMHRAPVEARVDGRHRTSSPKRVLLPVAKRKGIFGELHGKVTNPVAMVDELALLDIESEAEPWVVLPSPASFETGTPHSPTTPGSGKAMSYMSGVDVTKMKSLIEAVFDPTRILSS